jgi:GNAT superfamily N-acetyltransferase
MKLETKRLLIFPLSYDQLVLYLEGDGALEEDLDLNRSDQIISPELLEAFKETILPAVGNRTKNYLYSTIWTIIDKELNHMVGDLCFKGEPNVDGEIEIGYGIYPEFQGRGFMTEAINAISTWAFSQPQVSIILAETDQFNLASHRTLDKNNFKKFKKVESMIWWKLEKTNALSEEF